MNKQSSFNLSSHSVWFLCAMITCSFVQQVMAQDNTQLAISTLAEVRANGDITVVDNGDIYIADFGNPNSGNGSTVVKLSPDGSNSIFASGLNTAASGITHDTAGNIFVAAFNGGDVYRISPNGNKSKINSGLRGPVGLAFDNNSNLYVAECNANRISRLVNGTAQILATLPGVGCANGIVWGHDNAFYVLMWRDGNIFRVDLSGNTTLFADIPGGGGHIEFLDGHYYALSRTTNRVYQINTNGEVFLFAGTGEDGNEDGPLDTATISRPNGIGIDKNSGAIYLTGSSDPVLNEIPIRKIAEQTVTVGNEFLINYGLSGSWFEAATNGQGFIFDFVVAEERFDLLLYWFTYNDIVINDLEAELSGFGSTQSRWYTALGAVNGATVEMDIFRTGGGVFDQSDAVVVDVVGSIDLEFLSCFEAVLNYEFDLPEQKSGTIELQRLVPDILCETLANQN